MQRSMIDSCCLYDSAVLHEEEGADTKRLATFSGKAIEQQLLEETDCLPRRPPFFGTAPTYRYTTLLLFLLLLYHDIPDFVFRALLLFTTATWAIIGLMCGSLVLLYCCRPQGS